MQIALQNAIHFAIFDFSSEIVVCILYYDLPSSTLYRFLNLARSLQILGYQQINQLILKAGDC